MPITPNFTAVTDIAKRKRMFFDFLAPLIADRDRQILQTRHRIVCLLRQGKMNASQQVWLARTALEYDISDWNIHSEQARRQLQNRVDIVPTALALAQAANESAWGTSRFAVEGNNFFGRSCFTAGCGMIPQRRAKNSRQEIKFFVSPQAAVADYIRLLNTNQNYARFRELRTDSRTAHRPLDSLVLAAGLWHYSQRGQAYIDEIKQIIVFNKLETKYSDNTSITPITC